MKTIFNIEEESLDTTADCLVVLNNYKKSKWKRKTKFTIKINKDESSTVRVFTDGEETLSLLEHPEDGVFLILFDLDLIRPLIDKIQKSIKNIYTWDYGQTFINPWNMSVWIIGGDGGIFGSKLGTRKIMELVEDINDLGNEYGSSFEISDHPEIKEMSEIDLEIPEITKLQIEGEHFPPMFDGEEYDDYEMKWLQIGTCIDLSNY